MHACLRMPLCVLLSGNLILQPQESINCCEQFALGGKFLWQFLTVSREDSFDVQMYPEICTYYTASQAALRVRLGQNMNC